MTTLMTARQVGDVYSALRILEGSRDLPCAAADIAREQAIRALRRAVGLSAALEPVAEQGGAA